MADVVVIIPIAKPGPYGNGNKHEQAQPAKVFCSLSIEKTAVHAEDGSQRAEQFKQNFLAEQARLWGNDAAEQKQQIAQVQAKQQQQQAHPQTAVSKDF